MPLGLTKKILNESVLTDSFDRRSFVLGLGGLSVGMLLAARRTTSTRSRARATGST